MNEPTLGRDLLDDIEFVAVGRQHRQPRLGGGQIDQRIVQAFLSLMFLKALHSRQRAGDHAGFQPRLPVRHDEPGFRHGVDQSRVVVTDGLPSLKWTPFVGPRTVGIKVESRLLFPFFFLFEKPLSRFLLLFLLYCGYVGNAFALSKRSGISTGLAAASILSMPARHTAIGIWLFIA